MTQIENRDLEDIADIDSLRELIFAAAKRKLFYLHFACMLSALIIAPYFLILEFKVETLYIAIMTTLLLFVSAFTAIDRSIGKWVIPLCSSFILSLAWTNSKPTEGWGTLFYTDEQIEVFKEIEKINELSQLIVERMGIDDGKQFHSIKRDNL